MVPPTHRVSPLVHSAHESGQIRKPRGLRAAQWFIWPARHRMAGDGRSSRSDTEPNRLWDEHHPGTRSVRAQRQGRSRLGAGWCHMPNGNSARVHQQRSTGPKFSARSPTDSMMSEGGTLRKSQRTRDVRWWGKPEAMSNVTAGRQKHPSCANSTSLCLWQQVARTSALTALGIGKWQKQ